MTRAFHLVENRHDRADAEMLACEGFIMQTLWAHGPMRFDDLARYLERREWPEFWSSVAVKNLIIAGKLVERDEMLRPAAALHAVPVQMTKHWFEQPLPTVAWYVRAWRFLRWLCR